VTFLRFVVLTSYQLFSVDALSSSSSPWNEALGEGGVRAAMFSFGLVVGFAVVGLVVIHRCDISYVPLRQ